MPYFIIHQRSFQNTPLDFRLGALGSQAAKRPPAIPIRAQQAFEQTLEPFSRESRAHRRYGFPMPFQDFCATTPVPLGSSVLVHFPCRGDWPPVCTLGRRAAKRSPGGGRPGRARLRPRGGLLVDPGARLIRHRFATKNGLGRFALWGGGRTL